MERFLVGRQARAPELVFMAMVMSGMLEVSRGSAGDKEVTLNMGRGELGKEKSGKVSPTGKDLKSASKNTQGFDKNAKWVWTSGIGESRWGSRSHGIFWRAEVGVCERQGAQPFHSWADHHSVDPTPSLEWGLLFLTPPFPTFILKSLKLTKHWKEQSNECL